MHSFTLLVSSGFTGEICQDKKNYCLSEPCHPEGTLECDTSEELGFRCLCLPGWTGRREGLGRRGQRYADLEGEKERERQADRQTEKQRYNKAGKDAGMQRAPQRERERERVTMRESKRVWGEKERERDGIGGREKKR